MFFDEWVAESHVDAVVVEKEDAVTPPVLQHGIHESRGSMQ
jgi:hypothetical protein